MDKLQSILAILAFSAFLQIASCSPIEQFIVGGVPTTIAAHPHHLALMDMVRGGYMCGASNIHRLWALTAAHCLDFNTPPELVNLWGGSTSRLSGGHLFFVSRYILHPGYNRATVDLDIAVIEVAVSWSTVGNFSRMQSSRMTATILAVKIVIRFKFIRNLPERNLQPGTPLEGFLYVTPIPISPICNTACCGVCPEGPMITVAGWGRVEDGSLPENLRQVSKDIIPLALCNTYWQAWFPISHSKFCTRVEDGRDSCKLQNIIQGISFYLSMNYYEQATVTVVLLSFVTVFKSVLLALVLKSAGMEHFRQSTCESKSQQFVTGSLDLFLFRNFCFKNLNWI